METHAAIITRLGGIRKVATALQHPNHTTVQGWFERSSIPLKYWAEIVQLAETIEQPLTASDLMPAELRAA